MSEKTTTVVIVFGGILLLGYFALAAFNSYANSPASILGGVGKGLAGLGQGLGSTGIFNQTPTQQPVIVMGN